MPLPAALLAAVPGLLQAGGSLFGSRGRKRAEEQAKAAYAQQQASLQNFQFENPYQDLENPFEDATINQTATDVQRQQLDQNLAQILAAQVQSAGSGGVNVQALANAALKGNQQISADIARQEQANQARALQYQGQLDQLEARGAGQLQQQQYGQIQQRFNLAQQRLSQVQAQRQAATQQLIGGLGSAIGGAITAGFGGGPVGAPDQTPVDPTPGLNQTRFNPDLSAAYLGNSGFSFNAV